MTDSPQSRRHTPLRVTCAHPHQCSHPTRLRILAQISLFSELSESELDGIDHRMTALSYAAGDHLYRAGDSADYLYVVAAGQVKTLQPALNGQDSIVDMLGPGDLLGGLSVLSQQVYGVTAEALVTTCALRIDTVAFREVLLEHPQVALRALDEVTALLQDARSDTSQRATSTVAQRVATTLLQLAEKFGQHGVSGDGTLLQLPLSRADLAAMTGSTPESVSRAMSRLRNDGIIDSGRRWTSILDRAKLTAISNKGT
ncbi:transcriptional regulator, Crp/Fnr family [Leifsonia rubra CMS 76R]|nr:transcriptional regulator, Crp/Fnr family [Leifsonia rubra CMS 76R]